MLIDLSFDDPFFIWECYTGFKLDTFYIYLYLFFLDPLIVSLAQDIFRVLSENSACQAPVQTRLIPTLTSILQAPPDKIPNGMQGVSLDILQTLVRASSVPLSEALINTAFPAAVQTTLHTDDSATMQSGGECLRAYVSKSLEQVAGWKDGQGE